MTEVNKLISKLLNHEKLNKQELSYLNGEEPFGDWYPAPLPALVKLSTDESTPIYVLKQLLKLYNYDIIIKNVLVNPSTNSNMLHKAVLDNNVEFVQKLHTTINDNITIETVLKLIELSPQWRWDYVVPEIKNEKIFNVLVTHHNPKVRIGCLENVHCTNSIKELLLNDCNNAVRWRAKGWNKYNSSTM